MYIEMEGQVCTWSSISSYDTSPLYTTEVFNHFDQTLRFVLGVFSVYLCQFVADVAFRHCSIHDRTFLFEMQPHFESGQTLRGSADPHLRALFVNLKDHSKQANELLHEPHTASFVDVSKGCVRDLPDQITVVASLAPRQIDRGDVGWPYTRQQKQGSTEAGSVGEEESDSSFSNYTIPSFMHICQV
jgi:hypothetical protein